MQLQYFPQNPVERRAGKELPQGSGSDGAAERRGEPGRAGNLISRREQVLNSAAAAPRRRRNIYDPAATEGKVSGCFPPQLSGCKASEFVSSLFLLSGSGNDCVEGSKDSRLNVNVGFSSVLPKVFRPFTTSAVGRRERTVVESILDRLHQRPRNRPRDSVLCCS